MKLVLDVNLSFCLILTTLETYLIQMTLSIQLPSEQATYYNHSLTKSFQQKHSDSVSELDQLNQILYTRIKKLESLCNSMRFLRKLSANFLNNLNELNERNKITSIEVHGVPTLHMKEQYSLVEQLSKHLLGYFHDEDIAGIRDFFTHKDTRFRNLIVQFKTVKIKNKWFTAFINRGRSLGYGYMKSFPGFNLTLYEGIQMPPITIRDHLSKHKASILRVAQALLSKFKYVKVFLNNTEVYADRKVDTDTFVRYWIRDFEDSRNLKHILVQEGVPMLLDHFAHDEITPNLRYVYTKPNNNKPTSKKKIRFIGTGIRTKAAYTPARQERVYNNNNRYTQTH
uniref:Uncharacterized protein n=1 Tax=Cacopsylla melanoneura TaxID=428564 RepID=A0A8D9F1S1_9HEMI